MRDLKNQLKKNRVTIGSWITLGHTAIPEIMAKAGFDWLVVDMEHSAITLDKAQQLMQIIELSGITPLVRVGENNPAIIKRVMDAGAHGGIVPMVNNREDAIRAVNAVKYPPAGIRGVGLARAQGYGLEFDKYRKWVNRNSIVVVQIEHIKAIENLEDILSIDGIDASMIGPYDLSGSLGMPGDLENPKMKKLLARYEKVSKKLNKPMGFHVVQLDIKKAVSFKKRGYVFIAVGLDTLYLGEKCIEITKGVIKN